MKLQIASIKLKASASPQRELELFNEVQFLTVKIKAAGGENSLRFDEEYLAMLAKHLTVEQKIQ